MSENRFNDCDTIEDVLAGIRESVGKGWIIDRDIDAEALARIRELTPPTVSGEARERARAEMAQMLNDAANGRMAAGFQIVDDCLDRIIDALGYSTVATLTATDCAECGTRSITRDGECANKCSVLPAPTVSEEARERARAEARKWWDEPVIVGRLDYSCADKLADRIIDALGYQPAEPREWSVLECLGCGDQISAERYGDHRAKCPRSAEAPASPPVVELDADELRGLADALEGLDNYADGLTIGTKNGAWVLRIGGTDE